MPSYDIEVDGHRATVYGKYCLFCKHTQPFETLGGVKSHITQKHPDVDTILKFVTDDCKTCGEEFERKVSDSKKFCCRECHVDFQRKQESIICTNCNEEFEAAPSLQRKFCSQQCYRSYENTC